MHLIANLKKNKKFGGQYGGFGLENKDKGILWANKIYKIWRGLESSGDRVVGAQKCL